MSPDLLMSDDDNEASTKAPKLPAASSIPKNSTDSAGAIADSSPCSKDSAHLVEPPCDAISLMNKVKNNQPSGIDSALRKRPYESIARDCVGASKSSKGSKVTKTAKFDGAHTLSSKSTAKFLRDDSVSARRLRKTQFQSHANHQSSSLHSSEKYTSNLTRKDKGPNLTIYQSKNENSQSQSTSRCPQNSISTVKPSKLTATKFQWSDSESDEDDIQTRLAKRREKKKQLAEMTHVAVGGGSEISIGDDTELVENDIGIGDYKTNTKGVGLQRSLQMNDIDAIKCFELPDEIQSTSDPTMATKSLKKQYTQSHLKLDDESTILNIEATYQKPPTCLSQFLHSSNEKLEEQAETALDASTSTSIAKLGLRQNETLGKQESPEIPATRNVSLGVDTNIPMPSLQPEPAVLTESPLKPPIIPPSPKPETSQNPSTTKMQPNFDPIVASMEPTPPNVKWTVEKQCLLVRNVFLSKSDKFCQQHISPRNKVAGFDLDQTLVQWRCSGWPSRPEHYELWNASVINKLRRLHDEEQYKLVIFSNQGGIRGAFQGKTATRIKGIIDWIAKLVDRPLFAVCSTLKNGGYHKGNPGMWNIMKEYCNGDEDVHPHLSIFVGDSDGSATDSTDPQHQHQQSGVDKMFAENVGMTFYTPNEYFEVSNMDKRRLLSMENSPPPLPEEALNTRAALLGGYLAGPVLLILCGVQGSGKSTFSQRLFDGSTSWCQYNQDSIRNGRPGDRKAVEKAVRTSLNQGKNVVVDRMHLDPTQRAPFLEI